MPVIDNKSCTGFQKQYDADGKVWVRVTYANDGVAKTPMFVVANEYGYSTLDFSDTTINCYIGVPDKAYATGVEGPIQIGGPCEDVITASLSMSVGHAFALVGGAITDVGADFNGNDGNQFGVAMTATTSSTTQDIMLVPETILTTT